MEWSGHISERGEEGGDETSQLRYGTGKGVDMTVEGKRREGVKLHSLGKEEGTFQ